MGNAITIRNKIHKFNLLSYKIWFGREESDRQTRPSTLWARSRSRALARSLNIVLFIRDSYQCEVCLDGVAWLLRCVCVVWERFDYNNFFILFTKRRNFFSLSVWGIFNDLIGIWAAWTWIERINSNGNSNNNNNTDIHTNSNSIHITYATHFDFLYGGYDVF